MEQIITDRLVIRKFEEKDGKDLFEYLSDEAVVQYEPYDTLSMDAVAEEAKKRSTDGNFLAVCLPDGKLIGNLYFSKGDFDTWAIGYVFNKNYWGKGYAVESAKAVIAYAFEKLGARRIVAMCNPQNEKSWKLLERIPMRREGTLLKNIYFFTDEKGEPIWQDTYEYGLLRDEYVK